MDETLPVTGSTATAEDNQPLGSQPEQKRRGRIALAAKKAGALSLAMTVIASGIATARAGDAGGFARAAGSALGVSAGQPSFGAERMPDFGLTWHPLSARITSDNQTLHEVTTPAQTLTATTETRAPMPWALEFSQDPEAHDTAQAEQAIDSAVAQVLQYQASGFSLEGISLQGFASDEDNQPGGGLNEPNKLNQSLAETRAKSVEPLLVQKLHAAGVPTPPVTLEKGQEIIDPQLDQRIADLATHKGVSVLELVQNYNRNRQNFSVEDLKVLDGLAGDRFVRINLKFIDTLPAESHLEAQHTPGSIILVPIIVPWFKRRRKAEGEDTGGVVLGGPSLSRRVGTGAVASMPAAVAAATVGANVPAASLEAPSVKHIPVIEAVAPIVALPEVVAPATGTAATVETRPYNPKEAFETKSPKPAHATDIHQRHSQVVQPRPHNFHGGRLSTKGGTRSSRPRGRARGGHRR